MGVTPLTFIFFPPPYVIMANKYRFVASSSRGENYLPTGLFAPSIKAGLEQIVQYYRPLNTHRGAFAGVVRHIDDVEVLVFVGKKLTNRANLHIYNHFSTYHLSSVKNPNVLKHYELDGPKL